MSSVDHSLIQAISQLAVQVPILLVYAAGIFLALVFWQRSPKACVLVLAGSTVLLLVTLVHPFVTHYVIQMRSEGGMTTSKLGFIMSGIALASSFIFAIGLGLILAAVFLQLRGPGRGEENAQVQQPTARAL